MISNLQNEIESIASQLIEKYKPEKVILFGSAARGDAGDDSDADFLIIKKDTPYKGRDRGFLGTMVKSFHLGKLEKDNSLMR